jgi:excisionase family DNA binding protein
MQGANMERETPSDNVANSIVAARPWLTLERLLEVLPLKKKLHPLPKPRFALEEGSSEMQRRQPPLQSSVAEHQPDPSPAAIEALLTSKEASQILKIHPKVLERMAKRGEVPALKVGKFWRYRATTLDAWINSRLQSGRQPCRMETSF